MVWVDYCECRSECILYHVISNEVNRNTGGFGLKWMLFPSCICHLYDTLLVNWGPRTWTDGQLGAKQIESKGQLWEMQSI